MKNNYYIETINKYRLTEKIVKQMREELDETITNVTFCMMCRDPSKPLDREEERMDRNREDAKEALIYLNNKTKYKPMSNEQIGGTQK